MPAPIRVLALFAHPDDMEFMCAGTLAHLADKGAVIHVATMTAGDCGSTVMSAAKISRVRQKEAARSARLIGGTYTCLKEKDLFVLYERRQIRKTLEIVRRVKPELVFTHSPSDYMLDHEITSHLVKTACFGALIPNFKTGAKPAAKHTQGVPHLYYMIPFGGRDILGNQVRPRFCVDVTTTIDRKEKMLACHESQFEWLKAHQEITGPLLTMREMAKDAGKLVEFESAEGFRQHLGQGFPQNNLLAEILSDLVREV